MPRKTLKRQITHRDINFEELMDLRIDYAFKLVLAGKNTRHLINLLNAIFSNKNIPLIVADLTIENTFLERRSKEEKLSVLDIRATLNDGMKILIEMHRYDVEDIKYKNLHSWAKVYGESLGAGQSYSEQSPVIIIAFVEGTINSGGSEKIHRCYRIMEKDEHSEYLNNFEMHYINMKAFIKEVNGSNPQTVKPDLANWLTIITMHDIKDKSRLTKLYNEQEELAMLINEVALKSKNKAYRQAYEQRQNDITNHYARIAKYEREAIEAGQALIKANDEINKANKETAKAKTEAAKANKEAAKANEETAKAKNEAAKSKKESAEAKNIINKKDEELERLNSQIAELNKQLNP